MPKCTPNDLIRNTLLIFSLLLLGVTMNANCPKWWLVPDPLLQSKAVKATRQSTNLI